MRQCQLDAEKYGGATSSDRYKLPIVRELTNAGALETRLTPPHLQQERTRRSLSDLIFSISLFLRPTASQATCVRQRGVPSSHVQVGTCATASYFRLLESTSENRFVCKFKSIHVL